MQIGGRLHHWNRLTNKLSMITFSGLGDKLRWLTWTSDIAIEQDTIFFWVTTNKGLVRWNRTSGSCSLFDCMSQNPDDGEFPEWFYPSMFKNGKDSLWMTYGSYLVCFVKTTQQCHWFKNDMAGERTSELPFTHHIIADGPARFWLATSHGLYHIDTRSGMIQAYYYDQGNLNSLSYNYLLSLCRDPGNPDSVLWIGTKGGGLNRLYLHSSGPRFSHFTTDNGLPDNTVYGILPDGGGNLWLSTNNGLSKFDIASGSFRNYKTIDGLQSSEFNTASYYKSNSGEMFFGGVNGLNYFHPDSIKDNQHIPPVVITKLKIDNKEVTHRQPNSPLKKAISQTREITLSYREKMLAFEFAALDYHHPESNRFRFRMKGMQDNWIDNGNERSAVFTNLAPGSYIFQVKGSNNDGIWNEKPTEIAIKVTPPIWATWYAYLLYFLIATAIGTIIFRVRTNRIRLKARLEVELAQSENLKGTSKN